MVFWLIALSASLPNGLGLTPPMGWCAWEQFHCNSDCANNPRDCLSESLITDMIDHLEGDGWLKFGYEYVNLDDCWTGEGRDSNGELFADPDRFPHGIAWLATYAHDRGVKLGIFLDYGSTTCSGGTGSRGYLRQDALTLAKWGIDSVKMETCGGDVVDYADAFEGFSEFLNVTGRPILYGCSWPRSDSNADMAMVALHCNLWRIGGLDGNWDSVKGEIDRYGDHAEWAQWAGPGHWNDPDQLVIGMRETGWATGLSPEEGRSQMGIWAILAAPLLMSVDLRDIPTWARDILQNTEVIAVNQDKLGKAGHRATANDNDAQVWVRELEGGDFAVVLFNRGDTARDITVKFSQFSVKAQWTARNLWTHEDLGNLAAQYTAVAVPAHDSVILRFH